MPLRNIGNSAERSVDFAVSSKHYALEALQAASPLLVQAGGAIHAAARLLVAATEETPPGMHPVRGHLAYRPIFDDLPGPPMMVAAEVASRPDCYVFVDAGAGLVLGSPAQLRIAITFNDQAAAPVVPRIFEVLLRVRSLNGVPLRVTGSVRADADR